MYCEEEDPLIGHENEPLDSLWVLLHVADDEDDEEDGDEDAVAHVRRAHVVRGAPPLGRYHWRFKRQSVE